MADLDSRPSTAELGGICLALREDLTFSLQSHGGQSCYVLEDELHGTFFRIGIPEYTFLSLLDGRTSVEQALARTAVAMGPNAIREQDAASICQWLVEHQLARTLQSGRAARLSETHDARNAGQWKQYLNPLVFMVKLGNPGPVLERLLPSTRWMFGPIGVLVWFLFVGGGLSQVVLHWHELAETSIEVITPHNCLGLGASWLLLKVIHETAHGLSCLRFGGQVRTAGLNSVLFVPLPFVDVTSSWRFASKWQRIAVAAAGMYAELLVAALAALCWSHREIGFLRQICANLMVTGGFLTILFNANPLVRFDGYYILADWLELPNLAQHAHQDLLQLGKHWLFGVSGGEPTSPPGSGWIVRIYGILSSVWKVTVTASLIVAAETLYHGAGFALAIVATVLWVLWPLGRFLKYAVLGDSREQPHRLRFALIAGVSVASIVWCWQNLSWAERLVLPAIVDYTPAVTVRSPVGGFVTLVAVRAGEAVDEGALLLQLRNLDFDYGIAELQAAIAKSEVRGLAFEQAENLAAQQVETENRVALRKQLSEKQRQQTQLAIRAPASGLILAADLSSLEGRYVSPGETLFLIGDEQTKKVQLLVSQTEIDRLRTKLGDDVEFTAWSEGGRRFTGRLTKVDDRATVTLRHPALAAVVGGPLPVRSRQRNSDGSTGENDAPWELLEPHFIANVELPLHISRQFGAGQLGSVHLTTGCRSLGEVITQRVTHWFDEHRGQR